MTIPLATAAASSLLVKPLIRTLSNSGDSTGGSSNSASATEFQTQMRQFLTPDSANQVSEEDLFAALIQQRIKALKGDDALKKYQDLLKKAESNRTSSDGFVAVETSARAALKNFVRQGGLTKEEADKIHSEAFNAAQLDDNKLALFDSRGGTNDPTKAVALLDKAIEMAEKLINSYDQGSVNAESKPLASKYDPRAGVNVSTHQANSLVSLKGGAANPVDGPNGFLFKPISEKDGNLAVLLPEEMTGGVSKVVLKDKNGHQIASSRFFGVGNGNRGTYRFGQPGAAYPKDLMVEVTLDNGELVTYKIPDPSKRYD